MTHRLSCILFCVFLAGCTTKNLDPTQDKKAKGKKRLKRRSARTGQERKRRPLGERVLYLVGETRHICALTESRRVYCWGITLDGKPLKDYSKKLYSPSNESGWLESGEKIERISSFSTGVLAHSKNKSYWWARVPPLGEKGNSGSFEPVDFIGFIPQTGQQIIRFKSGEVRTTGSLFQTIFQESESIDKDRVTFALGGQLGMCLEKPEGSVMYSLSGRVWYAMYHAGTKCITPQYHLSSFDSKSLYYIFSGHSSSFSIEPEPIAVTSYSGGFIMMGFDGNLKAWNQTKHRWINALLGSLQFKKSDTFTKPVLVATSEEVCQLAPSGRVACWNVKSITREPRLVKFPSRKK